MKPRHLANAPQQQGFALLEALVAILIFSVGILSLVGMQATATRYATDSQFRSTASYLANQRLAELWVASPLTIVSAGPLPLSALPGGTRTDTVAADATGGFVVTVKINWQMPGDATPHTHVAMTTIHGRCNTAGC
jgi:type IV pilus assembly protein PilV